MIEVKAYKCDFCYKCFGRKVNAIQHEPTCKNNPEKRHCRTCVHSAWRVVDCYDGDNEVYGAYCDKYDKTINDKPYLIECETGYSYVGEEITVPYTCENYEYKGYAGWKQKGGIT